MTLPRCKYGYSGGLAAEWGQWSDLEDGTFDQCRRLEHGDNGGSWHFPESGGAVSKHGKSIDDPEKWEPMWQRTQEWEASDERSLIVLLYCEWGATGEKHDEDVRDWLEYRKLTVNMARDLVAIANGGRGGRSYRGLLVNRQLITTAGELTPVGRQFAEILRGWDRA